MVSVEPLAAVATLGCFQFAFCVNTDETTTVEADYVSSLPTLFTLFFVVLELLV